MGAWWWIIFSSKPEVDARRKRKYHGQLPFSFDEFSITYRSPAENTKRKAVKSEWFETCQEFSHFRCEMKKRKKSIKGLKIVSRRNNFWCRPICGWALPVGKSVAWSVIIYINIRIPQAVRVNLRWRDFSFWFLMFMNKFYFFDAKSWKLKIAQTGAQTGH